LVANHNEEKIEHGNVAGIVLQEIKRRIPSAMDDWPRGESSKPREIPGAPFRFCASGLRDLKNQQRLSEQK
jgi:hypothetical protein